MSSDAFHPRYDGAPEAGDEIAPEASGLDADSAAEPGRLAVVANLLTMGNAVCGFVAVILAGSGAKAGTGLHLEFKAAAWLIIFGMILDVLDGRVARTTGSATDIGAHLDSLADLVTFGLAPAVVVFRMHQLLPPWSMWRWALWCLSIAYFLGAVLRLARFTAETGAEESSHLSFRGLPSPGAAGVLASSVIFYFYLKQFKEPELRLLKAWHGSLDAFADYIPAVLPFLAAALGYLMVSDRLRYAHVPGYLIRRRTFDSFAYLVFGIMLIALVPEVILPCLFFGYLATSPVRFVIDNLPWRKVDLGAGPE
jgi:CDP-diacylglycerol--serine O-phosphatidyltransferase